MKYEDVERWVQFGDPRAGPYPREEQPYRECPNCGKHRYRYVVHFAPALLPFFGTSRERYVEVCRNCKESSDEQIIEV